MLSHGYIQEGGEASQDWSDSCPVSSLLKGSKCDTEGRNMSYLTSPYPTPHQKFYVTFNSFLQIDMSKCMVSFIDWYLLRINASEREKIKVRIPVDYFKYTCWNL